MLILPRKVGGAVCLSGGITVTLAAIVGRDRVEIDVTAPLDVHLAPVEFDVPYDRTETTDRFRRYEGEQLIVGETVVTVVRVATGKVRLGFEAGGHVGILRAELVGSGAEGGLP